MKEKDMSPLDEMIAFNVSTMQKKKITRDECFRLCREVLKNALEETKNPHPKIRQDALNWVFSRDTDHFLSFENICFILHLDVDYIRTKVQRQQRN